MAASTLTIKDLHVEIEGKEILKGVNLEIKGGEFHAVMVKISFPSISTWRSLIVNVEAAMKYTSNIYNHHSQFILILIL